MVKYNPEKPKAIHAGDTVSFWENVTVKVWTAPKGGIKFWDKKSSLNDAYKGLHDILERMCNNEFAQDGSAIRDNFMIGMHDERNERYTEFVEFYEDEFISLNDWHEGQSEMYLDWVIPMRFGLQNDIWEGIGGK